MDYLPPEEDHQDSPQDGNKNVKRKITVWIQDVDQFVTDINDPHMQAKRTLSSHKSQVGINLQRLDQVLKDPDKRSVVDQVAAKILSTPTSEKDVIVDLSHELLSALEELSNNL